MKTHFSLLALAACAPLFAQTPPSTCTQVSDTLYALGTSTPVLMTGTIDLALGYSTGAGTFVVVQSAARQTIAAGALSTCLTPGNYQANYSVKKAAPLTGVTTFTRFWTVPSGGGPYNLSAIETSTATTPVLSIAISQLSNGGATSGQCLAWNGSAWAPASCGSGGGGTGTLTNFLVPTVPPWLTATVTNPTTTPGLTLALNGDFSATSTATLGTIVDGDCAQVTPFTLTGVTQGSAVFAGVSITLPAGVEPHALVTGAGLVTVSVCNLSEGPVTLASATYKVAVIR